MWLFSRRPLPFPSFIPRADAIKKCLVHQDFELTPGLISREDAHRIYVQLAYPTETLLTPKLLAAREGPQGRRAAAAARSGADGGEPPLIAFWHERLYKKLLKTKDSLVKATRRNRSVWLTVGAAAK